MIGERERLPNIHGYFDLGYNSPGSGVVGYCMGTGAFRGFENTASTLKIARENAAAQTTARGWSFDASLTGGTGAGVYKSDAHVRPNNIAVVYWKRSQ